MYTLNHLNRYFIDDHNARRRDAKDFLLFSPVNGYLDYKDQIDDKICVYIYSPSRNNDASNIFSMPFNGKMVDVKITNQFSKRDPVFKPGYPSTDLNNNKYYYPYCLEFKLIADTKYHQLINTIDVEIYFGDRNALTITSDYQLSEDKSILGKGEKIFITNTPMRTMLYIHKDYTINPELVQQIKSDPLYFESKDEQSNIDKLFRSETLISWYC